MKIYIYTILLSVFLFLAVGCNERVTILAGIQNGESLEEGTSVPFMLYDNYPDPFNPRTTIRFQVADTIFLKMAVYTEDWQEVKILFNRMAEPGYYSIDYDATNNENKKIPSGEYYYTLEGNGITLVSMMKYMK